MTVNNNCVLDRKRGQVFQTSSRGHVLKIVTSDAKNITISTCFQIPKNFVSKILEIVTALLSLNEFLSRLYFSIFSINIKHKYDIVRDIATLDQCI